MALEIVLDYLRNSYGSAAYSAIDVSQRVIIPKLLHCAKIGTLLISLDAARYYPVFFAAQQGD